MDTDLYFILFPCLEIQFIKVTPVFVNHLPVFACWPHAIKILMGCELFQSFSGSVVLVDVQFQVAVGSKIDVVAKPGWDLVSPFKIGDLLRCVLSQIIDP